MFKSLLGEAFDAAPFVITSFFIFFVFFMGIVVWTLLLSKKYTDKMKNLPLQDEPTSTQNP